jgi:hypothetical protein
MKHLKAFQTNSDYQAYMNSGESVIPNCYLIREDNVLKYNSVSMKDTPFFFEAIEDGSISYNRSFEYSYDMTTWLSAASGEAVPITTGQKLFIKKTQTPNQNNGIGKFTATSKVNIGGNFASLTNGDSFKTYSLSSYCGYSTFSGMTTLVSAENLYIPNTPSYGFMFMFSGCSSLEIGPTLNALTLSQQCYYRMFQNCSSLRYIKMMATDISASQCLSEWVSGVSSTGTFVKNAAATWNVTGANGIPSGWTVETAEV